MRRLVLLLLFAGLTPTWADYTSSEGLLTCDSAQNRFMVRFAFRWNEDAVKDEDIKAVEHPLINKLKSISPSETMECQLANGSKISLNLDDDQSYPYGEGGAAPPSYFTLTISDTYVYYRKEYSKGYGATGYPVAGVFYDNGLMESCGDVYSENDTYQPVEGPPQCHNESARLKGQHHAWAQEEIKAWEDDQARDLLAKSLSPFCKTFGKTGNDIIQFIENQPDYFKDSKREPSDASTLGLYENYEHTDLNNDGKADVTYRLQRGTHYFDGAYLVTFPEAPPASVEKALRQIDPEEVEHAIQNKRLGKATLVSLGENIRYTTHMPYYDRGQMFIFAYTTNRRNIPSAFLGRLKPDSSLETLCRYP